MNMPETQREVAERIVKDNASAFSKKGPAATWVVAFREAQIIAAIEAALKERDERAARAVCNLCRRPEDYHAAERDPEYGDWRHKRIGFEDDWNETCKAAAIRNEDSNA